MSFLKNSKFWAAIALVASLLCILSMVIALMGVRMGWESMDFRTASTLIRNTVEIGIGVIVFSILVMVFARKDRLALTLSSIATVLLLVPIAITIAVQPAATPAPAGGANAGGAMGAAGRTPPLNDISTDTLDPPIYSAVIDLRPEGSNTLQYPENGPSLQAQLFPDIAPIQSSLAKTDAFNRALEVVDSMGWDLVYQDMDSGMIEAVSSTLFFSFEDDVVIRVRANGSGSVVDIRSHSRVGRGDRGKNAERVRAFIDKF